MAGDHRTCVAALLEAKADISLVQPPLPMWLRGVAPAARSLTLATVPASLLDLQRSVSESLRLDAVNDFVIISSTSAVLIDTSGLWPGCLIVVQPVSWLIATSNSDEECFHTLLQLQAMGLWIGTAELDAVIRKVHNYRKNLLFCLT